MQTDAEPKRPREEITSPEGKVKPKKKKKQTLELFQKNREDDPLNHNHHPNQQTWRTRHIPRHRHKPKIENNHDHSLLVELRCTCMPGKNIDT